MAKQMTIQQIMTRGEHEGFTAYQIHRLINVQLSARGLDEIKPQMMYNYDRNGLINGTKNQIQSRNYTLAEVQNFVSKFVEMRTRKGKKVTPTPAPSAFTVDDVEDAMTYQAETNPTLI